MIETTLPIRYWIVPRDQSAHSPDGIEEVYVIPPEKIHGKRPPKGYTRVRRLGVLAWPDIKDTDLFETRQAALRARLDRRSRFPQLPSRWRTT